MGITHLSGLEVAGVPTQGMGGALPLTTSNYFFVSSVSGSDGNTGAANNAQLRFLGQLTRHADNFSE